MCTLSPPSDVSSDNWSPELYASQNTHYGTTTLPGVARAVVPDTTVTLTIDESLIPVPSSFPSVTTTLADFDNPLLMGKCTELSFATRYDSAENLWMFLQ